MIAYQYKSFYPETKTFMSVSAKPQPTYITSINSVTGTRHEKKLEQTSLFLSNMTCNMAFDVNIT